ncbi:MAG: hypothetical protein KAS32_25520 [Candidatus Peribacteraceae bacterium]|nr:hypothetical protein [Candidatus Peribacteraceae bacterium]
MNKSMEQYIVTTSPLTGKIYLARMSKRDPCEALEKKDVTNQVMQAIIRHMMYAAPIGASQSVRMGDHYYGVTVKPITKEEFDKGKK